ncbi:MAG: hypothetical protein JRF43_04235 [Deltaproteobacteria bacterium]|nr:hypothetical protein [Deltaproteobacteria bacterium]
MSNIQEPLKKIFDRHRIVFWYDTDKELRADYEALDLPDVIKVGDKLQTDEILHKLRKICANFSTWYFRNAPQCGANLQGASNLPWIKTEASCILLEHAFAD